MLNICVIGEKLLREFLSVHGLSKDISSVLRSRILHAALDNRLQSRFSCAEHSLYMLKEITSRFLVIRIKHEAQKAITTDKTVRSKLNKLVLFSNI